jgi:hypothetical protein
MRWRPSPDGHDPRQIDLLAVLALLVVIIVAGRYLIETEHPARHFTTSFIEPSQTARW